MSGGGVPDESTLAMMASARFAADPCRFCTEDTHTRQWLRAEIQPREELVKEVLTAILLHKARCFDIPMSVQSQRDMNMFAARHLGPALCCDKSINTVLYADTLNLDLQGQDSLFDVVAAGAWGTLESPDHGVYAANSEAYMHQMTTWLGLVPGAVAAAMDILATAIEACLDAFPLAHRMDWWGQDACVLRTYTPPVPSNKATSPGNMVLLWVLQGLSRKFDDPQEVGTSIGRQYTALVLRDACF